MHSHCRNRRDGGFTLIEALVALAIAGLALAAVAGVVGTGVLGHETAAAADTALSLAEEKLAGAEAAATARPGHSAGVYDGRFNWRVAVTPYEDGDGDAAAAAANPLPAPGAANLRLYRIDAVVAWTDGRRQRQVALSTLRLLPAPP